MRGSIFHLARRALSSWRNNALSDEEFGEAAAILNAGEYRLWQMMQPRDCRHSLMVLERFISLAPSATREEMAAALLHDVGKVESNLGWVLRIIATIVGARGPRFSSYHDHEAIGAELLSGISDPRTIDLVAGRIHDDVSRALQAADDI